MDYDDFDDDYGEDSFGSFSDGDLKANQNEDEVDPFNFHDPEIAYFLLE